MINLAIWNRRALSGLKFTFLALVTAAVVSNTARAGNVPVPNGSFETIATAFADPRVDSWQKTPRPDWWDDNANGPWDQLTGVFANSDPTNSDHIVNCDGSQALFLLAIPTVGIFQDYNSLDWSHTSPTHAFDAVFESGKSYQLTIGAIGGGPFVQGQPVMPQGSTLLVALYYTNSQGAPVIVAQTTVTNTIAVFNNNTNFVDFQVNLDTVKPTDAWAGKHMGIEIVSTAAPTAGQPGYWDLDNVRLTSVAVPLLGDPLVVDGKFSFTIKSDPGLKFDVLSTSTPGQPLSGWSSLGQVTNLTGTVTFIDPTPAEGQRFYSTRQVQ